MMGLWLIAGVIQSLQQFLHEFLHYCVLLLLFPQQYYLFLLLFLQELVYDGHFFGYVCNLILTSTCRSFLFLLFRPLFGQSLHYPECAIGHRVIQFRLLLLLLLLLHLRTLLFLPAYTIGRRVIIFLQDVLSVHGCDLILGGECSSAQIDVLLDLMFLMGESGEIWGGYGLVQFLLLSESSLLLQFLYVLRAHSFLMRFEWPHASSFKTAEQTGRASLFIEDDIIGVESGHFQFGGYFLCGLCALGVVLAHGSVQSSHYKMGAYDNSCDGWIWIGVWVIIHHALLISLWRLPWYPLFSYSGMGMVTLRGPVTSMGLSCMGITMISVSSARWISSIMICSFNLSPPRQLKSSSRVRSAPANLAIMVMMYSHPSLSHRSITASSLQSLMERTAPTASKTLVVELDRLVSYRIPARTVKRLFNCLVLRTLVVSWEIIAKPSRTKMGTRSVKPMFSRRWVPGEYLTPEWKQYQLVCGRQIFLEVTPGSTMGVTRTLGPRRNCVSAIQSMQVLESRGNSKKRGLQMVPSPLLATNCWYMYFRREQRSLMFLVADCRTVSPKAQGSCGMEPSSLWSLAKVQTAPNWNHLAQSSGLVFPPNPQMSGPTIWKPNICALKLSAIDPFRYSQLALLSPVQWKPNLLEPMVELRVMMKGRSPLYFRNWLVAQVSRKALKTCTSASERLPQWVALREMVCDSIWSAPGWQGRSLEQSYLYSPEGPEQAPSQKLANSFMSSQIPENLTLAQSLPSISSQQEVALGWKKSTKVVGPGQTRPTYGFWVLLSMMQTFRLRPSSQAGPEVLMPASMMGMYRYFSNILFSLSRGNLFSSMVKSSQSIMQSISVQMVSRGMPLLSQPEMTFQRQEMFLYPQRHWWKPKLQKGGRAALPLQRLSFQRVVQGFCSPRKNRKSMMPPITLKVRQCLPSETDLMTSMALELRRQLMWKRLFLSLSMQKGKQPQVCSPSPLSMTCPLSRLKTVHFPLPFLKVDWNLSPIPQMYSLSTSVPIQRQWSLQMTFWLQVEKRTAPFCLRMILKSKGEEANSNETAELAMGKEKLPSGSMGKMPYWGTSYLLLLGSVILKEKSKKVWVRKVKRRVLMMGLLSLMKQLSDPVQFRVSWMVVLLRNQFTTLYSDLARTERERRVQMRRYLQSGCIHQISNSLLFGQDMQDMQERMVAQKDEGIKVK